MFRIQSVSLKSEYLERSLCSHGYDLHSPLTRLYKTEITDPVSTP